MAREVGISHSSVQRIWNAHALQPHRVQTFKFTTDPDAEEKIHDVVGLYLNPPDNAVVLSVDEKTQVQALARSQPLLPLRPGLPERRTHDYIRHGVTSLYAALEVASGRVWGECSRRHTAADVLRFLKTLARSFPRKQLHIILDNSSTHSTPAVSGWMHIRAFTFISLLRALPGSTWSRPGSEFSRVSPSDEHPLTTSVLSSAISKNTSTSGTHIPLLSFGPRNPPTSSRRPFVDDVDNTFGT